MHGYGTYKATKRTVFRGVCYTFASCSELKIKLSLYRPGEALNAPGA
jgi:hypothetical protein